MRRAADQILFEIADTGIRERRPELIRRSWRVTEPRSKRDLRLEATTDGLPDAHVQSMPMWRKSASSIHRASTVFAALIMRLANSGMVNVSALELEEGGEHTERRDR
jgi:hypothetical protein